MDRHRLPWEFPYGTPDSLSYLPSNPYAKAPSNQPIFETQQEPIKHTLQPTITGTSILGIKYKDGVMLCGDTLVSYGSLAKFRTVERIKKLNKNTMIGGTGDYSDFQFVVKELGELITRDEIIDDGSTLSPKAIHSFLTRRLYQRRNKMNPLWGQFVIAGFHGKPILGLSDLRGTSYEDETIATGFGAHLARPLLRKGFKQDLSKEEAKQLLETSMRVLFYRDARSYNRIQLATVTADGVEISSPYELQTDWSFGNIVYSDDIQTLPMVGGNNN